MATYDEVSVASSITTDNLSRASSTDSDGDELETLEGDPVLAGERSPTPPPPPPAVAAAAGLRTATEEEKRELREQFEAEFAQRMPPKKAGGGKKAVPKKAKAKKSKVVKKAKPGKATKKVESKAAAENRRYRQLATSMLKVSA